MSKTGISWNANAAAAPKSKGVVRNGPKVAPTPSIVLNKSVAAPLNAAKVPEPFITRIGQLSARNLSSEPHLFLGVPGSVWFLYGRFYDSGRRSGSIPREWNAKLTTEKIQVKNQLGKVENLKVFILVPTALIGAGQESQDEREMFTILYQTEPYAFRKFSLTRAPQEDLCFVSYRLPVVMFSNQQQGILWVDRKFCVSLTNVND